MLCLPRHLRMEVHKVLRLPRNLRIEVHKGLCLPRTLHMFFCTGGDAMSHKISVARASNL